MIHIFVDADACPVKNEVYRVARRYGLQVTLVANSWMRVPE
ncbi:MAG: YaiI/YqxD family protein, partial [Gemmatimonadota bacterium]